MAENIVAGLFGLDPNDIRENRMQQGEVAAQNFAQLDPFQRANYMMFKGGQGLGHAGAGMFGLVDPRIESENNKNAIASQIDWSNPEAIMQGAALYNQAGMPREAAIAVQYAQKINAENSKMALESAQAHKAMVAADEEPKMRHEIAKGNLDARIAQIENQRIAAEQASQDRQLSIQQRADAVQVANKLKAQQIEMQKQIAEMNNQTKESIANAAKTKPLTDAQKIKQKEKYSKDKEGVQIIKGTVDEIVSEINKLIGDETGSKKEHAGLKGSVGYIDSKLPPVNKEQSDAQALIAGLMAKLSVEGLSKIRTSGSAPGSITEKEWPIFQNYIKTVNPQQSYEQFVNQLKELRMQLKERKSAVDQNFADRYSDENEEKPDKNGNPAYQQYLDAYNSTKDPVKRAKITERARANGVVK